MKRYLNILFVIGSLILLSSCQSVVKSIDCLFNPSDYEKRESVKEKLFVYDTVVIYNDNGELGEPIKGDRPIKEVVFDNINQSYTFKPGEAVSLVFDNVDFSNKTFDIVTDEVTNEVTMKLVDLDFSKVLLSKKCQSIIRKGKIVPKIEVAEGLNPEQVVITPLFDDNCFQVGYEIRYGAIESGCKDIETLKAFRDYKCCKGKKPPYKKCNDKGPTCPSIFKKLGIPCK